MCKVVLVDELVVKYRECLRLTAVSGNILSSYDICRLVMPESRNDADCNDLFLGVARVYS